MSRKQRRHLQPNTTRKANPMMPPGSVGRSLATGSNYPGQNAQGDNSTPAAAYFNKQMGTGVQFAPGDPLRPTPGLDDGRGGPRSFAYPVGGNIVPQPRHTESTSFEQLRNLASLYEGVQLCENVIFRIIRRLELSVVPRPDVLGPSDNATDPKWQDAGRQMAEWFMEPDHRGTDIHSWMIAAVRDLKELDALGIFHRRTRSGGLYGLEYVAGDTISCLVDAGGRAPLTPAPAYAQILYGVPAGLYTRDEMDYLRMTPRTDSLYGTSDVERILLRINQALRKEHYDLARYTDGATPSGVLETQNQQLFTLTSDEVQLWQDMWNATLSGNDALRVRTKAVPPGWTFKSLQQTEIATPFDSYLLNVTCAGFGMTMAEIGFTENVNKSSGDSQENVTYRNAVAPTSSYLGQYFTRVISRYDGQPISATGATVSRAGSPTKPKLGVWDARYKVTWTGIEEPEDFNAKATSMGALVTSGIIGPTEAKQQLKLPISQSEVTIPAFIVVPGSGIVFLEDALKEREDMAAARQAQRAITQTQSKELEMSLSQQQQQGQDGMGQGQDGEDMGGDTGASSDDGSTPSDSSGTSDASADNTAASTKTPTSATTPTNGTAAKSGSAPSSTKTPTAPKGKAQRLSEADHQHQWGTHNRCMVCGCGDPLNDHGKPMKVADPDDANTGCMVAFFLPASVGQQVALPDGEPMSDLHITLAYLGNITDGLIDKDRLLQTVHEWSKQQQTLHVDIEGLDRLNGDGSGDSAVVMRSFTMALYERRADLVQLLDSKGLPVDKKFPEYKPHVTLCYIPQDAPLPDIPVKVCHAAITNVWVAYGDERYCYEFGGGNDTGIRASKSDVSDEWARYRDKALRAVKRGQSVPTFTTDILPSSEHAWVAQRLQRCATADDVRAVFTEARQAAVTPSSSVATMPEDVLTEVREMRAAIAQILRY